MSLSEKDRALIEGTLGVALLSGTGETYLSLRYRDFAALLQAAREEASQGAGEPVAWRVKDFADGWFFYGKDQEAEAIRASVDGFLVQPLYTSPPTDPRIKALEEALETARDALQAAYQRTGHADDLAGAHIADAALSPVQAVKGDDHG